MSEVEAPTGGRGGPGEAGAASEREAHAEAVFGRAVRLDLRRNYLAHLAHGLLGQTGMRLLNAPTFVPAYVFALSGSELAVGAARSLQYFGMFLSPIAGATVIEHRHRVLPVAFLVGALMRVQILGLALAGIWLAGPAALWATFAFLALFGVFLGVQGVAFNVLVSKVIPVERRGLLMGLRNALAGITAAAVAIWAGKHLVGEGPWGYAQTFGLAFVLTSCGLAFLLFVREPAAPRVRAPSRVRERLRDLPALLRGDRDFTRYFTARALAVLGRMAQPFYWIYASTRMPLSGVQLGELTAAFVLAQSVGNLGWGLVADRRGFRAVFLHSLALWMLSAVVLLQTDRYAVLIVVFAGLGAGLGGFQMSAQNLVLEFGARHDLPLRIAVANSASELVAALGALLGGALALWISHTAVFAVAIASQAVALVLVLVGVREPRTR